MAYNQGQELNVLLLMVTDVPWSSHDVLKTEKAGSKMRYGIVYSRVTKAPSKVIKLQDMHIVLYDTIVK